MRRKYVPEVKCLSKPYTRTVEWTCRASSDLPVGPVVSRSCLHGIRPPKLIVRSSAPKKVKEKRSPFHHHLIVRPPRPQADYDSPVRKLLTATHGVLRSQS